MRHQHLPVTDSTSTRAAALLREAPGAPVLVSADEQTAGRGRHGRTWCSPVGGAWFTLGWPTTMAVSAAAAAPLLAGLAVRDQVASLLDPSAARTMKIKWPNDVLLGDGKLAGILCEQHLQASASPRALLVGVGINVNLPPEALGDDLRQPATSLRVTLGRDVDLKTLIERCAERIAMHMRQLERDGFTAEHARQLNETLAWRGERVEFERGDDRVNGVLHGIDEAGRAIVGERVYNAGEVARLAPAGRGLTPGIA